MGPCSEGAPVFGTRIRGSFAQSIRLPVGNYIADVHEGQQLVRSFSLTVGGDGARIRIP